ncbi:MAG: GGDEF domain-containing protein [Planctomycetota bacterium]|jgi:diguanylate cyclase (GGDEF)-like protein
MSQATTTLFDRLVGAAIMLIASVTFAAVVLHGWQMHGSSQRGQREYLRSLARLGAAELSQAADGAVGATSSSASLLRQFDRWGWAVIQQPPVLATALLDDRGRVRSVWPQETKLEDALPALPPEGESTGRGKLEWSGHELGVWVAACPLRTTPGATPPGRLVVVAQRKNLFAAWRMWAITFALPLGGVAAIGFTIGLRWLRQSIREPLRTLVRHQDEEDREWLARLPTDRDDELGGIARGTGEIIAELCDARARLDRLQHSLDSRVAERTREIKGLLKDAQRQVWLDPLTRLGNRRLLDDRLEALFRAQREEGGELTVVMFDIDHFKEHNDTLGHAAGDELLRFFGQLLRSSLRETDLGIRFAGDEFAVLLLDVDPHDAAQMATRIVRLFAQHTSLFATRPRSTLSAGVASMRLCRAVTGKELLAGADAALYQAKGSGKNGVCVWTRGTLPLAQQETPPLTR